MTLLDSIRLGVSESVFWYPTFTLPIFAAIWMCALLICLILSPKLGLDRFARWSRNSTLFIASLFVFSLLANAVFVAICRGRIYEPRDPIVDYFPFLPGEFAIDFACGGHYVHGATHAELESIWLAISIFVWASTFALSARAASFLNRRAQSAAQLGR
jgi:hypothetical protein